MPVHDDKCYAYLGIQSRSLRRCRKWYQQIHDLPSKHQNIIISRWRKFFSLPQVSMVLISLKHILDICIPRGLKILPTSLAGTKAPNLEKDNSCTISSCKCFSTNGIHQLYTEKRKLFGRMKPLIITMTKFLNLIGYQLPWFQP